MGDIYYLLIYILTYTCTHETGTYSKTRNGWN